MESVPPEDDPDPSVHRGSLIAEVLDSRPDAARVLFEEFGLPCYDCPARFGESLAQGLGYHDLDPDAVVARLNACPPRASTPAESA